MTSAPVGAGSPMIAGNAMPGGEYTDFSNPDGIFDLPDGHSPDTLQSLDLSVTDNKTFISPQDLTAPLPDSPNGSYQDSSSESASTKRAGSASSPKLEAMTGDTILDDLDVNMDWGAHEFPPLGDDDNAFHFDRDHIDPSNLDDFYMFKEHDDAFMDQPFEFDRASTSPAKTTGSQTNMPSPEMPTIKTNSPMKPRTFQGKQPSHGHQKGLSQHSLTSSMNGLKTSNSREVSPMSNIIMSHDGSPSAMVQSPLSNGVPEFQFNNSLLNGNTAWANTFAFPTPAGQDAFRAANYFGAQMGQPLPMMPLPNRSTQKYNGPYHFQVLPTPLKSRVETQIPIRLAITPLPPGVKKLHLPTHTISKPKLLAKPTPERSPDILELFVTLVCTSAMEGPGMKKKALERAASHPQRYLPPRKDEGELSPQNGGDVRICEGCITRERKRAARKKIKKPEEEKIWSQDEEHRVVVFNCQEVKDWVPFPETVDSGRPDLHGPGSTMYLEVPMRIACYCRHHSEKMGFNVIFTLKDYQDRVIAQAMSNPIMITDDHKTHLTAPVATAMPERPVANISSNPTLPMDTNNLIRPAQNGGFHMSLSNGDLAAMQRNGPVNYQSPGSGKTTPTATTSHTLSRPASPGLVGPATKKRKASGSRLPDGLTMTRLDTSPSPSAQGTSSQISAATSPFTPSLNAFSQADARFAQQNVHAPFATGPSTPNSNDFASFHNSNRSASMDNLSMAQLYSAPASKHPSRAPSPNGLRNSVASSSQFARELMSNVFTSPTNLNQPRAPPIMHKIIPNEGPTVGGIEVTVLGAGFHQGLEVWFGNNKATTTTFWGESSLVCLLPPSESTGVVAVRFNCPTAQPARAAGNPATLLFKYIDVNEDQLIRTALTILGQKMQGPSLGAPELARRILQFSSSMSGGLSGGQAAGGHVFNHASYAHLESQLLKCLDFIDLDDSPNLSNLDLTQSSGHTMLHLACSLGYHRFVAALLARGADPNAQDNGGYTPLHFAAINNQPELARRLILSGADSCIRTLSGLTAADVATTRSVLRAMRRSKRHVRSRSSGGSLHSRTSSATSLRSLWEPMTKIHTLEEPSSVDSSEESPEYTSGDLEDEDPDEDTYLTMRRSSGFARDRERPVLRRESAGELEDSLASPTSAITAAVKEQFQQLMAMHFPQMQFGLPGIPMLPDYQAYLQQAPFMRRVTQLMPGMGGRPNAGGEAPKTEGHWWDVSSYKTTSTTLPPAYEDIFPQDQRDEKQASACLAAAEAEADVKCASLYDQAQSSMSTMEETQSFEYSEVGRFSQTDAPEVLKIGRKNQITREQREQFLRAKEEKLKRLSNDRNLFFIWIPLLLIMICAMLYSYFPVLFTLAWAFITSVYQKGTEVVHGLIGQPDRVRQIVEV